jgi:hypothetical protein
VREPHLTSHPHLARPGQQRPHSADAARADPAGESSGSPASAPRWFPALTFRRLRQPGGNQSPPAWALRTILYGRAVRAISGRQGPTRTPWSTGCSRRTRPGSNHRHAHQPPRDSTTAEGPPGHHSHALRARGFTFVKPGQPSSTTPASSPLVAPGLWTGGFNPLCPVQVPSLIHVDATLTPARLASDSDGPSSEWPPYASRFLPNGRCKTGPTATSIGLVVWRPVARGEMTRRSERTPY